MVESESWRCEWCEDEQTFKGEDAEQQAREAGWLTHIDEEGEREYCSLACAISAL